MCYLVVAVEQGKETIPVVGIIVDPEVTRHVGVGQHPAPSWQFHLTVKIWLKMLHENVQKNSLATLPMVEFINLVDNCSSITFDHWEWWVLTWTYPSSEAASTVAAPYLTSSIWWEQTIHSWTQTEMRTMSKSGTILIVASGRNGSGMLVLCPSSDYWIITIISSDDHIY